MRSCTEIIALFTIMVCLSISLNYMALNESNARSYPKLSNRRINYPRFNVNNHLDTMRKHDSVSTSAARSAARSTALSAAKSIFSILNQSRATFSTYEVQY